jgi:hypothetical protein
MKYILPHLPSLELSPVSQSAQQNMAMSRAIQMELHTNIALEWAAGSVRILNVLTSHPDPEADYPSLDFRCFPQPLQRNAVK